MIKKSIQPKNEPPSKPAFRPWVLFENVLLIVVLAVTSLRAAFIEITYQSTTNPLLPLPAEVISLLLSTVLIGAFCLWLALRLFRPKMIESQAASAWPSLSSS